MSWQSYVDDHLIATGKIKHAVICGHDGNIWAASQGFAPTVAELSTVMQNYGNVDAMAMGGVRVGGDKYMFLSGDEKILRAKKGKGGLHAIKTLQGAIVTVYEEGAEPGEVAVITEKLGEYLISVNY